MCLVGYAVKYVYSAGKTSALLSGGASGANRYYVVANCWGYFGLEWFCVLIIRLFTHFHTHTKPVD